MQILENFGHLSFRELVAKGLPILIGSSFITQHQFSPINDKRSLLGGPFAPTEQQHFVASRYTCRISLVFGKGQELDCSIARLCRHCTSTQRLPPGVVTKMARQLNFSIFSLLTH